MEVWRAAAPCRRGWPRCSRPCTRRARVAQLGSRSPFNSRPAGRVREVRAVLALRAGARPSALPVGRI